MNWTLSKRIQITVAFSAITLVAIFLLLPADTDVQTTKTSPIHDAIPQFDNNATINAANNSGNVPPINGSHNTSSNVDNAHSIATNIMIQKAENVKLGSGNVPPINGSHNTSSNIPIVFSAVDGDRLVVGIDANVLLTNTTYSEAQIQNYLGVDIPIDIKYMTFHLDGGPDVLRQVFSRQRTLVP